MGENPGEPGRLSIGSSVIAENLERQEQGKPILLHEVDPKTGSERVGGLYTIRF